MAEKVTSPREFAIRERPLGSSRGSDDLLVDEQYLDDCYTLLPSDFA